MSPGNRPNITNTDKAVTPNLLEYTLVLFSRHSRCRCRCQEEHARTVRPTFESLPARMTPNGTQHHRRTCPAFFSPRTNRADWLATSGVCVKYSGMAMSKPRWLCRIYAHSSQPDRIVTAVLLFNEPRVFLKEPLKSMSMKVHQKQPSTMTQCTLPPFTVAWSIWLVRKARREMSDFPADGSQADAVTVLHIPD